MGHLVQPPPVSKTRSIQRGRGTATLSRAALKTTCTFATYLPRTPSSKLPPSNSIAVRERGNSSAPASLTYFQRLNGLLLLVGGGEQLLRPLLCAPGTRIVRIRTRTRTHFLRGERLVEKGTTRGWGERSARFSFFSRKIDGGVDIVDSRKLKVSSFNQDRRYVITQSTV